MRSRKGNEMMKKVTFISGLVSRLFCFGLSILCLDYSVLFSQSMPHATIWETIAKATEANYPGRDAKIKSFIDDCSKNKDLNTTIPQKTEHVARVATFNVHYWQDAYDNKYHFNEILETIKKVNTDILILQEVCWKDDPLIDRFKKLGYEHYQFCKAATATWAHNEFNSAPFGNVIFSKYKIEDANKKTKMYVVKCPKSLEDRCYSYVEIILPNQKHLHIYGTHLDVFCEDESARLAQITELTKSIKDEKNVIVAADFNAVREEDYNYDIYKKKVWDLLVNDNKKRFINPTPTLVLDHLKSENFVDCFAKLGIDKPKFTVWSGTVVDFIFLKNWNLPLSGCYVYYDASSDHLPVIMDIKLQEKTIDPKLCLHCNVKDKYSRRKFCSEKCRENFLQKHSTLCKQCCQEKIRAELSDLVCSKECLELYNLMVPESVTYYQFKIEEALEKFKKQLLILKQKMKDLMSNLEALKLKLVAKK